MQEGHEGEVNAVRWGPSGRMFASGGSDRKVKLWELRGGMSITTGGVFPHASASSSPSLL